MNVRYTIPRKFQRSLTTKIEGQLLELDDIDVNINREDESSCIDV